MRDCQSGSKNKTQLYVVYKKTILIKKTYRLKVSGWRKIYHAHTNQKIAGVTILTLDKADFKARKVIRDKEGHYIIIKGSFL